MHVKQHVKEFVHDVKRKFSSKHNRDSTCSTCALDNFDGASAYSSAETFGTTDDSASSSSASSLPNTPRRKRLISFLHPHTPSSPSKHHNHNVLHKVKRVGSKRYRLFSAPSTPSMHVAHTSGHTLETEHIIDGSVWEQALNHPTLPSSGTSGSSRDDYPDVIDISARSVNLDSVTPEDSIFRDSTTQSQPPFDMESRSETTSGTLFTIASGDFKRSTSDSDSPFHSVNLHSDENPAPHVSSSFHPMAQDPDVPPVPPLKSDQLVAPATPIPVDDEEITLAHSVSPSSPVPSSPAVSQPPRSNTTVHPIRSTPASPAPVYIPRLTAPSMFLPIPNTDPLSALLTKYVPAEQRPRRDPAGEYVGRGIHEMVMSNSWRALARMARDKIVASDPEDLTGILDFWSLRLSSLARLRLTNQAAAECNNLFAVLNAVHPTSAPGSFPGSATLNASIPLPSSPAHAPSMTLSPSGLGGLAQLPGTPSQKPSALPSTLAGGSVPATASQHSANELSHPFELSVFHARVHYWSGDALGYVDALSRILEQCKERAREEGRVVMQRRALGKASKPRNVGNVERTSQPEETNGAMDQEDVEERDTNDSAENTENDGIDDVLAAAEANLSMWLERVARVCLILASQMIEMNDYQAAINLLAPLCTHRTASTFLPTPSPELHSALARVYLLAGNLEKAEKHFSIAASTARNSTNGADIVVMNTALWAVACGDWARAEEALGDMIAKHPENTIATNNLAVTLLCQGRIKEGIGLLEGALNTSPSSVVVAEPFLFNLSTLYELRSAAAIDKKRELLIKVAQWSGDGLKTSCLKMPSS